MMAEFSQAILHTWHEARKKHLSVRETERLAKKSREAMAGGGPESILGTKRTQEPATKRPLAAESRVDPNEADVANRIQDALGTKVSIRHTTGGAGRIEIEFYSEEDLSRLADALLSLEKAR